MSKIEAGNDARFFLYFFYPLSFLHCQMAGIEL
jgi:hypothetical protein